MKLKYFFLICAMGFMTFCSEESANTPSNKGQIPAMTIKEVLAQHNEVLMAFPGVVGTAQSLCDGQPCIKVYVVARTPKLDKQIGDLLKSHLFQIQESGKFKSRPASQ